MYTPIVPFSGLQGYRVLVSTEEAQREAYAEDAATARNVEYFQENIGNVSSSDELLADRRLLEVALTAYGLQDEIDKTAFIKRVLDEGTEDDDAFANRLNDRRWQAFSEAFGFGNSNSGGAVGNFQAAVELKFRGEGERDPLEGKFSAADVSEFRATIGTLTSVDDLLASEATLDIALQAFGLERGYYSDDHFRQLLTEGLGTGTYAMSLDSDWQQFTQAFQGLADGAASVTYPSFQMAVERELERRDIPALDSQADADADSTRISEGELTFFVSALESAATPADALSDSIFIKVTRAAYQLTDSSITDDEIRTVLQAAADGDMSLAEAKGGDWLQAAEDFAAGWSGGTLQTVSQAEYEIEVRVAQNDLEYIERFHASTTVLPTVDEDDLAYFQEHIGDIDSAEQLMNDDRLLEVALRAFGLENENVSDAFLQSLLEDDAFDESATVNFLTNPGWKELAQAFQADSSSDGSSTDVWRYELENLLIEQGAAEEDINYLRRNWNLIEDAVDITLDPKLMDIAISAFGLEKDAYTSNFVLSVLDSNIANDNSFVNVLGDDRWLDFAKMFNNVATSNVQSEEFQTEVVDNYLAQGFEIAVGDQDEQLRLALNFSRTIADIAGDDMSNDAKWLSILGDTPLRTVLDSAFGLPTEFQNLDIDVQAATYKARARQLFGTDDATLFLEEASVTTTVESYLLREQINSTTSSPAYAAVTMLTESVDYARSINARA